MPQQELNIEQVLINKINSKVPFEHGNKLPFSEVKVLHSSINPSLKYKDIYTDIYKYVNKENTLIKGMLTANGLYKVSINQEIR